MDCGECVEILLLNDNKQVIRWSGVFDPNTNLLDAFTKVTTKIGNDKGMPKPKEHTISITLDEGHGWAHSCLRALSEGFAKSSHKDVCKHLFTDELSWDWSDGTKVCSCACHYSNIQAYYNSHKLTYAKYPG